MIVVEAFGLVVERPRDGSATRVEAAHELLVDLLADINGVVVTARALVADGGLNRLAVAVDGDGLAAHGVVVGLGAHHRAGDGHNVIGLILARVILTTGSETDGVVGKVTSELALTALVAVTARAGGRGLSSGRRRRRRGRRRRSGSRASMRSRRGRRRRNSGGRLRRRRGRRSLSVSNGGLRRRLKELSVGRVGLRSDDGSLGGFLANPNGGGRVDDLGDILNLGHPLDLSDGFSTSGMKVSMAVSARLSGSGCDKKRRGDSEELHCE